MLVTGIKSKPVYAPLRADTGGRYHLMLGMGLGAAALLRVLGELKTAAPQALVLTRVLLVPGDAAPASPGAAAAPAPAAQTATAPAAPARRVSAPPAISAPTAAPGSAASGVVEPFTRLGLGKLLLFEDAAKLLEAFRAVLSESLMGTRLYVAGPESFIGLAMKLALEFDLNKDEIRAEELGTLARRVHCVHCRAATENVRTNIATCAGCGRWLLVRDHYSRRLAAYMGVMVDAEVPGERPSVVEVYL